MKCNYFARFSDGWVQEKTQCTNPNAKARVKGIQQLISEKRDRDDESFRCVSAMEFKEFLIFKGLGRSVSAFLKRYEGSDEVEKVTARLFESQLWNLTFADTENEQSSSIIISEVQALLEHLQKLYFVGVPVASACLALTFPELCGTVDYIVPAILHNERDSLGKANPLLADEASSGTIKKSLLLPLRSSLTPREARQLASNNYALYCRELWNIKRNFKLSHLVREIEVALWSFGLCYLKKTDERQPLEFRHKPQPPVGGLFAKYCPNDS